MTSISQTEVADILNEVLPTDVVKYIASYHAHPLASMRPWCLTWRCRGGGTERMMHQEQDCDVLVLLNVYRPVMAITKRLAAKWCSCSEIESDIHPSFKGHEQEVAFRLYTDLRWITIYERAQPSGIPNHFFPLTPKNTKKQILDFAAEQSIKLSMSWTKAKMLMVFNSKYGA